MEDELPPPYSPATSSSLQSVSCLLSSHLRNLPGRISSARAARTSERDERDGEILALLIPHIEDLIHTVTDMEPPPRQLEMTMVPDEAVGDSWRFSDEDRRHKLIKIRGPKRDVKEKPTPSRETFDEWGRWEDDGSSSSEEALWWQDDEMASRLARYLQPERPPRPQPQPIVPQVVKKGWGFLRKNEPTPVYPPERPRAEEDPVTFTVRAEEVTFRRENEMGIWESKTGWGLVVRIRVRQ